MRVAAIQIRASDSKEHNIASAGKLIDTAAADGAELIVLPELFAVPFVGADPDPAYFELAEPLDGPSNHLAATKSSEHGITIVSSAFEASTVPGVYHNTACTFVRGEHRATYRKSHLPFSNAFPEKYYFRPGQEPPGAVDIGGTQVGTIICYERHYPELARRVALAGASVLCVPIAAASGAMREVFHLELRAHAVSNGFFVVAPNRIGDENGKAYFGASVIFGPDGDQLAVATDHGDGEVVIADADVDRVARTRRTRPFLRDRRPELYQAPTDEGE